MGSGLQNKGVIMSHSYSETIVYTNSEDGFLLEGLLIRPVDAVSRSLSIVWIHGNASRFYDYPYVVIGRALATMGYPFISANTRGHDISTFLWRSSGGIPIPWSSPGAMPVGGGSAWEHLDESPRDLSAWVGMAAGTGTGSVALVGHSSGAQRVVLYQAERQDARVVGIAFASPDLRGFIPSGEAALAQRMVEEGNGMDVLPAQPYAPWYRQSAHSVANKATILSRLLDAGDGEPLIATLHCQMLAFFGGHERNSEDMLETIRMRSRADRVDTQIIADTDHIYTGHEDDVANVIAQWATTLLEN
jgi:hypothetical protein